ncbi:hypothetical protein BH10ACT1_BH10ACT1_23030 [soil metagenome]
MVWDDGKGHQVGDDGKATGTARSGPDWVHLAPPIVLAVIVIAFAAANTRRTKVSFLVADVRAPLVVVLLATAVVGALIGALIRRRRKD